MPQSAFPETIRAAPAVDDIPAETRGPIRKCNAPRRWQKIRLERASASRAHRRAPAVRAIDTTDVARPTAPAALRRADLPDRASYSETPRQLLPAAVAPLDPASARSAD